MSFATDMQSLGARDGIDAHLASEIGSLVALKDFLAAKVAVEKKFADEMRKVVKKAKDSFDKTAPSCTSGTVEASKSFVEHYENLATRLDTRNDGVTAVLTNQLPELIAQKETLRADFNRQRQRLQADLAKSLKEVGDRQKEYDAACGKLKQADEKKTKLEAKGGKKFDAAVIDRDAKEKVMIVAHNNYVLAVTHNNKHQEENSRKLVTAMLDTTESIASFFVTDTRTLMETLTDTVDFTKEDEQTAIGYVREKATSLSPDSEYTPLQINYKTDPADSIEYVDFKPSETPCIQDSSRPELKDASHRNGLLSVEGVDEELAEAKEFALDAALKNKSEADAKVDQIEQVTDDNDKPMKTMNTALEDAEARAEEVKKYRSLRELVEEKGRIECEAASFQSKADAIDGAIAGQPAGGSGGDGDDGYLDLGDESSLELRDQLWYHGVLARAKVAAWLVKKGDFLVRESANNQDKIVLSVYNNPQKKTPISHFQITQEEGLYSFEGAAFGSIRELLDHHVKTKEIITQKSQAVIINGAKRTERPYSHDDVKQGKRLGKGNFGDVYQGELIKDGTKCAIKTCRETAQNPERFLEEADTLNQYRHPNIVQIYGVVKRAPIWIVLELCTGGELLVYLRKQGVAIGIAEKTRWAYEAASGIAYLHTKNCIHRDLAARNCLLDGGDPNTLKISDFGMSRIAEDDEDLYTATSTARQIPIRWTAPEALEHLEYYTATDVWGYGVMMWEVFSGGKLPYAGYNNAQTRHEVVKNGYRLAKPDETPDDVFGVLQSCWEANKDDRPTMDSIEESMKGFAETLADQDA